MSVTMLIWASGIQGCNHLLNHWDGLIVLHFLKKMEEQDDTNAAHWLNHKVQLQI